MTEEDTVARTDGGEAISAVDAELNRDIGIVVPIANPEHTEQLLRTARDIAADRNGEILVLSVVTLPEQTPLSRGHQYVDQRREVLDQAMALLRNDRDPGSEPTHVSDGGR